MARGRRETPEETKRRCFILYDELQSYSGVGRQLNLAPNTVKSIILNKGNIAKYGDLLQQIAKIKEESNESLLKMLTGTQYAQVTKNAMDLLTPENLQYQIESKGIGALITVIGISYDKAIAYERLQLDKRKVALSERTLNLKEQELNARLENPEAFSNVTIINDIEQVEKFYKENGTLKEYASN